MYDITDRESFKAIDTWMQEVEKFASESAMKIIVGNKCEAEDKRKVSVAEGKEKAAQNNMKFIETSAKDNINVAEAFQMITKEIKARVLPKKTTPSATPCTPSISSFSLASSKEAKKLSTTRGKSVKKSGCCK